jgi:tripartite-type tricarboxylate transporter receptor subunit TctC
MKKLSALFASFKLAAVCATVGLGALASNAQAQADAAKNYPDKQIRIIVPYSAGGSTDALGRLVAGELTNAWKQTVIVENKPGASGMIGNDLVAKAAPDGYTVLLGITAIIQGPHLFNKIPYDVNTDLTPVAQIGLSADFLVVNANFPANTLEEFIKVVKANPGKYSYGSYGAATSSNIHGEMLKKQAGLDLTHIPYKGGAPQLTDLLGGQLDAAFIDVGNLRAQIKSDKIKILASTGEKRSEILPNVRTFTELGYKDFEPYGFFTFFLPSKTPKPIVDKLSNEIIRLVSTPENKAKIEGMGLQATFTGADALVPLMKRDSAIWGKVIKDGNIKVEQ